MRLISVNVGLPRDIIWRGKAVKSSIWKHPVEGRVYVSTLNLDGDQQSDLSVHGGVDKAVYIYPREHYSYWHIEFTDRQESGMTIADVVNLYTLDPENQKLLRRATELDGAG